MSLQSWCTALRVRFRGKDKKTVQVDLRKALRKDAAMPIEGFHREGTLKAWLPTVPLQEQLACLQQLPLQRRHEPRPGLSLQSWCRALRVPFKHAKRKTVRAQVAAALRAAAVDASNVCGSIVTAPTTTLATAVAKGDGRVFARGRHRPCSVKLQDGVLWQRGSHRRNWTLRTCLEDIRSSIVAGGNGTGMDGEEGSGSRHARRTEREKQSLRQSLEQAASPYPSRTYGVEGVGCRHAKRTRLEQQRLRQAAGGAALLHSVGVDGVECIDSWHAEEREQAQPRFMQLGEETASAHVSGEDGVGFTDDRHAGHDQPRLGRVQDEIASAHCAGFNGFSNVDCRLVEKARLAGRRLRRVQEEAVSPQSSTPVSG